MRKTEAYSQCLMMKGKSFRVGWLPRSFAIRERVVDLKIDGKWSNHWLICRVGMPHTAEEIEVRQHDWKKQRKASDI